GRLGQQPLHPAEHFQGDDATDAAAVQGEQLPRPGRGVAFLQGAPGCHWPCSLFTRLRIWTPTEITRAPSGFLIGDCTPAGKDSLILSRKLPCAAEKGGIREPWGSEPQTHPHLLAIPGDRMCWR